jgi:hypothetical protein
VSWVDAAVCNWHEADVPLALTNVPFEGNNGHDPDVTRCPFMTLSGNPHPRGNETVDG